MIVVRVRKIIIISVLILSFLTITLCFGALSDRNASAEIKGVKIVLDAGHGGIDDGAIGSLTGAKESEINLSIVGYLKEYLSDAGFSVYLTRSSDAGLYGIATSSLKRKDMEKRKKIIEDVNPTLVISVHLNKYSVSTRAGAQVFYKSGDESAEKLANAVQNSFNEMATQERKYTALTGDYYILNCTDIPSVICECGFLSNPKEERLLISEEHQRTLAYHIFCGIVSYLSNAS